MEDFSEKMAEMEPAEKPAGLSKRPKWLIIVISVVLVAAIAVGAAWFFRPSEDIPADIPAEPIKKVEEPDVDAPDAVMAVMLEIEDIGVGEGWQGRVDAAVKAAYEAGFNCLIVPLHTDSGAIYSSSRYSMSDNGTYVPFHFSRQKPMGKYSADRLYVLHITGFWLLCAP